MKQSATWITDWAEIWNDSKYIVCCIGSRNDEPTLFLYKPEIMIGWQVKRLLQKAYAALPMPEFNGKDMK